MNRHLFELTDQEKEVIKIRFKKLYKNHRLTWDDIINRLNIKYGFSPSISTLKKWRDEMGLGPKKTCWGGMFFDGKKWGPKL